jgi:hypothetical protein
MVCLWVVSTAGCATHDFRVRGDTLELYLVKPRAKAVTLACSLDDFEPHAARIVDGRWVVTLPSGVAFRYFYLVDGKPYDPTCRKKENDDFGARNCIYDPQM